jgi:hypothetical protein
MSKLRSTVSRSPEDNDITCGDENAGALYTKPDPDNF